MAQSRTKRLLLAPFRGIKAAFSVGIEAFGSGVWMPASLRFAKTGDALNSSVVMLPLRWLQRNSPQAILRVSFRDPKSKKWTPIDREAGKGAARMLDLVDQPNQYYDGDALEQATRLSEEVDGNAYWRKIRNSIGAVVELYWVPHTMIEPAREAGSNELITHYDYTPDGVTQRVAVEDIVHFRVGIDPDNTMKGMSSLKSVLREVYTDDEAASYAATILKNRGVPGIVVSPEAGSASGAMGRPDNDTLKDVKQKFEDATTGENRGRTIVMKEATKLQTFGFNPAEMSVRELRRVPEERVSGAIGVPAVVCGLGAGLDHMTFNNMGEAREAAAEEALIPGWKRRARTIAHQLLPDFEANHRVLRVDHDLSEVRILSEDQDKIVDRAVKLLNAGAVEVSEVRELTGFDVDDSHRIFLRPIGMLEVAAGTTGNVITEPVVEAGKSLVKAKGVSQQQVSRLQSAIAHNRTTREGQFAKRLETVFADLGKHVSSAWAAEFAKARNEKSEGDADAAIVAATMSRADLKAWRKAKLDPEYLKFYAAVYAETGKTITSTIGLAIEDAASTIELAALAEAAKAVKLVKVEEQTRRAIFGALEAGRAEGLGPVDLERKIRSMVEAGGPEANVSSRALRIARTETRSAQNLGAIETYKASGVVTHITVLDNRTGFDDPECVAIDGTTVSLEEAERLERDEHPNGTRDTTTPAIGD